MGNFKKELSAEEKQELLEVIEDYHSPRGDLRAMVRRLVGYLRLRNHV